MRWLGLAIIVGILGACLEISDQESAKQKFITFVQTGGASKFHASLLYKVHNPAITIQYGFVPACQGKYSNAEVENDIRKVVDLWIQPLRDWNERPPLHDRNGQLLDSTFVSNIQFVQGTPVRYMPEKVNGGYIYYFPQKQGSELDIVFYCRVGRSGMTTNVNPMIIFMYDETDYNKYSLATLVHEVGHVFGLADTYVDGTGLTGGPGRFNQSVCGSKGMVGCQPLSIMNKSNWLIEDNTNLLLGEDDIAGIRWLYRYIVTGDIQCPQGFVTERSTGGCVPEDPLAFALKQGDYDNAIELMIEQGINLNTQDKEGNSILHYAAQRAASHGGHAYKQAVKHGASPDLSNNAGKTPREILFPAITDSMHREKLYIAQELISLAID